MRKLDSYAQTKLPCLYAIYDYLCVHLIHISILIRWKGSVASPYFARLAPHLLTYFCPIFSQSADELPLLHQLS